MSTINRKDIRRRIHDRIRRKVVGTAERPRLAVHYSNQHIYAQVIDDAKGCTLCAKKCPADAIVGAPKKPHYIVADKCIGCGGCLDACRPGAISKQ